MEKPRPRRLSRRTLLSAAAAGLVTGVAAPSRASAAATRFQIGRAHV